MKYYQDILKFYSENNQSV